MKYKEGFEPNIWDEKKVDGCRFVLGRKGKNTLICIGANPSKADENNSDMTMNKLCQILANNGYDGYVMLNLYPLIATKPDDLPKECDESIYSQNLEIIKRILSKFLSSDILLCYGVVLKKRKYLQKCLDDIMALCDGRKLKCLDAITNDGLPPHPSRKSKTIKIIDFEIKNDNK